MKKFYIAILIFLSCLNCRFLFAQSDTTKIAEWTFETTPPTTAGPYTADSGTGSALSSHAGSSTYSNPAGNGSSHSLSSNGWAVGDYYQFEVSAAAVSSSDTLKFVFDQTGSGTGPAHFIIQTSIDGTNFTTLPGSGYTLIVSNWSTTTYHTGFTYAYDLSSFIGQSALYLRLVDTSTVSISQSTGGTSALGSGGTNRVDNVMFISVSKNTLTPVILGSFTAEKVAGGALLQWNTKTEINSDHFEVDKSIDGKTFAPITTIPTKNIISGADYSYLDNTYKSGIAYYQLKLVDADNSYKLSSTVSVGKANTSNITLKYTLVKDKVELNGIVNATDARIVNVSGTVTAHQIITSSNSKIDVSTLPAGIYFIQLSGSTQKNLKFVKQ
ncbi:MAG: T9SS type A sorting domain-containing protein [Arachidicoccus sp.]|nr:T9SS type A sorting domain-containing protein [Arachidicoccus sp.]